MISLILPYWDRQVAADRALRLIADHYAHLALEVVVVDDGNRVPFVAPDLPLNLRGVTLPKKDAPTPQSRAWNAGVAAASGNVIALSCVEILHRWPVLNEMTWELGRLGRDGYVLAAAFCPERREWHCRSDIQQWPGFPAGAAGCYLGMLHRELFERVGGFDEDYMAGAGYEDRDFFSRLQKAGARWKVRDDLIVIHPKTGATIHWQPEGFTRNADLFRQKWEAVTC